MKKGILTFALMLFTMALFAVPAKKGQWRIITLEDGTQIKAELVGDEFVSFYQSEDGKIFQQIPGRNQFHKIDRAEITEKARKARSMNPLNNTPKTLELGGNHQPYVGTKKCLCILVEFTDVPFQPEHTLDVFQDLINKVNYSNDSLGHVGSVRDYFLSQSNGTFDIQFDVVGPYKLSHNQEYYGKPGANGAHDTRPGTMIKEAIAQADGYVNFADYDWDGDGRVEPIFVLYSGMGQADGGGENTIWPHKSSIARERHDGVYVSDYACGSELNGSGIIDGIGTMCHEYSHCLGLPDTYDTDYSGVYGTSNWDIMNAGCYNGGGNVPCGYTAYERWYCGWINPEELTESKSITSMKPLTSQGESYVIRNDKNNNEYYMLENRAKEGWDKELPGEGLLIYHVDFESWVWAYNMVNTLYPGVNDHPRYEIVPADNSYGQTYSNMAADAFPANGNNAFMDTTIPGSSLFYPNSKGEYFLGKPIMNITKNEDKTISFDFFDHFDKPEKPKDAIFYESFSYCNNAGGNDNNFSPSAKIRFIADNIGWDADNAFGGSSCAYFGTNTKKGSATTPEFEITGDKGAVLTFRAVPFGSEAKSLNISIASGEAELETTTVALTSKAWQDYSIQINGKGKISLNFTSNSRRFFIDEVMVKEIVEPETIPGDVNGDNVVDVADINAVISVICGTTTNEAADVNKDNAVDVADINAIIAIICGE